MIAFMLGGGLAFWIGWRQIQSARDLSYFMLRRKRIASAWRFFLLALICVLVSLVLLFFGRQVAYSIVPPTPSMTPPPTETLTPTITPIPSDTPIPSVTPTPSITPTATITPIPSLPDSIKVLFRETVTPSPDAVFSPIQVATRLNASNEALDASDTFENVQGRLYGAFTYDNLQDGVRWTALWLRESEILCVETLVWGDGTGGYGYTECEVEEWFPGEYEIQLFLGEEWKVSARFEVLGEPQAGETPAEQTTPSP
jgi:hypothetical protein